MYESWQENFARVNGINMKRLIRIFSDPGGKTFEVSRADGWFGMSMIRMPVTR
jgi:hypothetical protein